MHVIRVSACVFKRLLYILVHPSIYSGVLRAAEAGVILLGCSSLLLYSREQVVQQSSKCSTDLAKTKRTSSRDRRPLSPPNTNAQEDAHTYKRVCTHTHTHRGLCSLSFPAYTFTAIPNQEPAKPALGWKYYTCIMKMARSTSAQPALPHGACLPHSYVPAYSRSACRLCTLPLLSLTPLFILSVFPLPPPLLALQCHSFLSSLPLRALIYSLFNPTSPHPRILLPAD